MVEQLVLVFFNWFSFFAFFDEIRKYVFESLFDLAALGHLLNVLHGDILESLSIERGKDLLAHVPVLFGLLQFEEKVLAFSLLHNIKLKCDMLRFYDIIRKPLLWSARTP